VTETDWEGCQDPAPMLAFLRDLGRLSERKERLWGCALCRLVYPLLRDRQARKALDVVERFADRGATVGEVAEARNWAHSSVHQCDRAWRASYYARCAVYSVAQRYGPLPGNIQGNVRAAHSVTTRGRLSEMELRGEEAALLRCVVGPAPFRPLSVERSLLSKDGDLLLKLARAAYDERDLPSGHLDPVRLGVLADALEENRCTDAQLLGHLRGPGPHCRGCWALDAVLGKE
jgi:hypothetical protein